MQRQWKTIWGAFFAVLGGWREGDGRRRVLFSAAHAELSSSMFAEQQKHLSQKPNVFMHFALAYLFELYMEMSFFAVLCSWHRNFFNFRGISIKKGAREAFFSLCLLACRMTSHNYANNFLLPCVFCELISSILRVTYKFEWSCNRVEKEHKRSITFMFMYKWRTKPTFEGNRA